MILICAPSAAGKSCLEKELVKLGYKNIISYTTRPKRDCETNDIDYHFIDEEYFQKKFNEGFWAENVKYRGWHYSIAKEDCNENAIAVVEPKGLFTLKTLYPSSISFFLEVPELIRLRRMIDRGDKDLMEMFRRIISDQGTFSNTKEDCDFIIDNNRPLEETVEEIYNILQCHGL